MIDWEKLSLEELEEIREYFMGAELEINAPYEGVINVSLLEFARINRWERQIQQIIKYKRKTKQEEN